MWKLRLSYQFYMVLVGNFGNSTHTSVLTSILLFDQAFFHFSQGLFITSMSTPEAPAQKVSLRAQ
jgi:hypothetical protein